MVLIVYTVSLSLRAISHHSDLRNKVTLCYRYENYIIDLDLGRLKIQ